jgi:hypothetical protein
MMRIALAAALLAAASAASAADSGILKPNCEPKPEMPRAQMRGEGRVMERFNHDVKVYQECMKSFITERQAAMKANEAAANDAIADYNDTMKKLNEQAKEHF